MGPWGPRGGREGARGGRGIGRGLEATWRLRRGQGDDVGPWGPRRGREGVFVTVCKPGARPLGEKKGQSYMSAAHEGVVGPRTKLNHCLFGSTPVG